MTVLLGYIFGCQSLKQITETDWLGLCPSSTQLLQSPTLIGTFIDHYVNLTDNNWNNPEQVIESPQLDQLV